MDDPGARSVRIALIILIVAMAALLAIIYLW
jgi:hypothetical protein